MAESIRKHNVVMVSMRLTFCQSFRCSVSKIVAADLSKDRAGLLTRPELPAVPPVDDHQQTGRLVASITAIWQGRSSLYYVLKGTAH